VNLTVGPYADALAGGPERRLRLDPVPEEDHPVAEAPFVQEPELKRT
jgi:hypothetical protein